MKDEITASKDAAAAKKRKTVTADANEESAVQSQAGGAPNKKKKTEEVDLTYTGDQPPAKLKRAFAYFVKAKRQEVEESLGANSTVFEITFYHVQIM